LIGNLVDDNDGLSRRDQDTGEQCTDNEPPRAHETSTTLQFDADR
jgi:hypothetical protein